MTYRKKVAVLILLLAAARVAVAGLVELGNDESYYWLYSKHLQWNYLDHPPMIALWLRVFTINLLLESHVVFLRLGSILACGIATWFMFKCVSVIRNERAGLIAAFLYSGSFYAGITAGLFVMPDAPQMVFWTCSMWLLARIIADERNLANWLMFGLASGLCIMSKIHGVFLWSGLGLFALFQKRSWLLSPGIYLSLLVALVLSSPILLWNAQYNFITFHFHGARVIDPGHVGHLPGLLKAIIGEIVINNPVNVVAAGIAVIYFWKRKTLQPALAIFNFSALPFISILLVLSFFGKTLPHWSGPAFVILIPVAAIWISELKPTLIFSKAYQLSVICFVSFLIGCVWFINFFPGSAGDNSPAERGTGDITLDMRGWKEAGEAFDKIYLRDAEAGTMQKHAPVVCNTWWGAHDEYYFCRPAGIEMIGLGPVMQIHQYAWLNAKRMLQVNMNDAYCIVHSYDWYDASLAFKDYYSSIDTAMVYRCERGGSPTHQFYILRLKGWKNLHVPQE